MVVKKAHSSFALGHSESQISCSDETAAQERWETLEKEGRKERRKEGKMSAVITPASLTAHLL